MKVALICCGRLENRYAVEFVEYYKQLGFNHIYIADNNRDNEEHFEDVLQSYIDEKFVTVYDYRNINEWIHYKSYLSIYYNISKNYDWVAFFDFDEFLTFNKDKTIQEYLSRKCFDNYNQILINWKTYTDNDLVYNDGRPCLERFTEPMELYKKAESNDWCITNSCVKTIIRTNISDLEYSTNHCFNNELLKTTTCNNHGDSINICYFQPIIDYTLSYIKHFPTKTIEEWINNKLIRGVGWDKQIFKKQYDIKRFFKYNNVTKEKIKYLENIGLNI